MASKAEDPRAVAEGLRRAVQRSMRQFDAELDVLEQVAAANLGLSRTDGRALEIIERHPSGIAPGELARSLGYTPSAATVVINRLEAAGLARRTLSEKDRRRLAIRPTDAGRQLVRGFFSDFGKELDGLLRTMTEEELVAVERFLREAASLAADFRHDSKTIDRA